MSENTQQIIGDLLKESRQAKQYSLQDVANQLKITVDRLSIIESDQYPNRQLDIYYRGHLRNYCEFLELEVAPVMEKLEQQGILLFPETASPSRPAPKLPMKFSLNGLIAIAVGLTIGGLIWLQTLHHTKQPAVSYTNHLEQMTNHEPTTIKH